MRGDLFKTIFSLISVVLIYSCAIAQNGENTYKKYSNVNINVVIGNRPNDFPELDYLAESKTMIPRISEGKIKLSGNIPADFRVVQDNSTNPNVYRITYNVNGDSLVNFIKKVAVVIDDSKVTNESNPKYEVTVIFNNKVRYSKIINSNKAFYLDDLFVHEEIDYTLKIYNTSDGSSYETVLNVHDIQTGLKTIALETQNESFGHNSLSYTINFVVRESKYFNNDKMPQPKTIFLTFPKEVIRPGESYTYIPSIDKYNPKPDFASMWQLIDPKGFEFSIYDRSERYNVPVTRAYYERQVQFIINGNIPSYLTVKYKFISSILKPKLTKEHKIKGKNINPQIVDNTLNVPIKILPSENFSIEYQKPYNFNISQTGNESDWRFQNLEIPFETNIIELDFQRIPSFEFFYIDLNGFQNLEKIKDLIRENIVDTNNDYFIFISNSSRPYIVKNDNDINNVFTQISVMRTEPASYYNESRFIKPYVDELNYNEDRREVHFHFLFSETFLNHSSHNFINDCLGNLNVDKLIDEKKLTISVYSTVEKPLYEMHDIDKNKINYFKLL